MDLQITDSSIAYNETVASGGGLKAFADGETIIEGSSIIGNLAEGTSPITGGIGGGIAHEGQLNLINCTVSGNESTVVAGGVYNRGDLEISQSTIAFNRSTRAGGLLLSHGTGVLWNSVVAENTATGGSGPDVYGAFSTASHHNLIGIRSDSTGLDDDPSTQYGSKVAPPSTPCSVPLPTAADPPPPISLCPAARYWMRATTHRP